MLPETLMVVAETSMVSASAEEALAAKLLSPLYFTVRECAPVARFEIES